MKYTCPVCGFDNLEYPPEDFNICSSCGTEFGYDDVNYTVPELRARWIKGGRQWWSNNDSYPIETILRINSFMKVVLDSQTTEGFKEIESTNKKTVRLDYMGVKFPNIVFTGELLPAKFGSMSSNNLVPVTV